MIEEHPAAVSAARDDRRLDLNASAIRWASDAYGSFSAAATTKIGIESPNASAAWSASNVSAEADRLTTPCACSSAAIAIESDAPKSPHQHH